MKPLLFSRTLAATGLALMPVAWLISGCGGGGGGSSNSNPTPQPTATATNTQIPVSTPIGGATNTPIPIATVTNTPIPTPVVPVGGQRVSSQVALGNGQFGTLSLVISRFGAITGVLTVPPIAPADAAVFAVQPGTYAVTGQVSLPNNFRFSGAVKTVTGVNIPFGAVGKTGKPGTITVTVGSTVYPTQTF